MSYILIQRLAKFSRCLELNFLTCFLVPVIIRLSLKRGFDGYGHGFDGCDGLGGLGGFEGLGGFGGFDEFSGFSRFDGFSGFAG